MKYAGKKILALLLTMVIVSFLAFLAFSLISGDPAQTMLGTEATPERVEALREQMGLNRPFLVRYLDWLGGFFTGDLGVSYSYKIPVAELIAPKLLVTLCLSVLSFLMVTLVSIPLGVKASAWAGRRLDAIYTTLDQLLMAVPPFFTGVLLTWIFSLTFKWFTHGAFPGLQEHFWASIGYLIFPAISIMLPRTAMTVRMLRSTILTEMGQDYVRTAFSRGNHRRGVLYRHVLKNSLVPVVTFLAQTMAELIVGSIVVEQVFAVPGLGRLLIASISNRDYPVVEAIVVILAFWVVLANTLADLVNQRIDPRYSLGGGRR